MTTKRFLIGLVALVLVLIAVSFVFYSVGDSTPGDGRGDTVEQSLGR